MSKEQFDKQAGKLIMTGIKMLQNAEEAPEGYARAVGMDGAMVNPLTGEAIYCRLLFSTDPMPDNVGGVAHTEKRESETAVPYLKLVH